MSVTSKTPAKEVSDMASQMSAAGVSDMVSQTPGTEVSDMVSQSEPVVLQKRNIQRTVAIACIVVIALVVATVAGLFAWKSMTAKELKLDSIKDDALRNALTVKYDKDSDGKLSEEELDAVQTLELDSGDDYSFLYLFSNLNSVNVKNSEVASVDLSKNSNLISANFKEAPNVTQIKLPDLKTYDDVALPENDDVEVIFPSNSEYEVKYVPKKVTNTTNEGTSSNISTKTTTYIQDVESATRVEYLLSSGPNFEKRVCEWNGELLQKKSLQTLNGEHCGDLSDVDSFDRCQVAASDSVVF